MNELLQLSQNFDFKIRRDQEKISYECRAYDSVDDRSLSWGYISKIYEMNNSGHKGLIAFDRLARALNKKNIEILTQCPLFCG